MGLRNKYIHHVLSRGALIDLDRQPRTSKQALSKQGKSGCWGWDCLLEAKPCGNWRIYATERDNVETETEGIFILIFRSILEFRRRNAVWGMPSICKSIAIYKLSAKHDTHLMDQRPGTNTPRGDVVPLATSRNMRLLVVKLWRFSMCLVAEVLQVCKDFRHQNRGLNFQNLIRIPVPSASYLGSFCVSDWSMIQYWSWLIQHSLDVFVGDLYLQFWLFVFRLLNRNGNQNKVKVTRFVCLTSMIASKPSRQGHSGAIVACYMTDETLKIVEPWTLCIHSWLSIPERSADTALYTGAARSLHM